MSYQISDNGAHLILGDEAFRAASYQDIRGIWTIGYGSTRVSGQPVTAGMTCTKDQALQWFNADCYFELTILNHFVKVPLNQNQVDALVSLMYNIGPTAFLHSAILTTINEGQPVTEDLFLAWDKSHVNGVLQEVQGLKTRRAREYQLFIS